MNKVLVSALVVAAVAGVVWYMVDEEGFLDTVDDIRDRADDSFGKVKERFARTGEEMPEAM